MSKQNDAKNKQGYEQKAIPRTCMTCVRFAMKTVPVMDWQGKPSGYEKETNLRCTLGNFAVKKMATCLEWAAVARKPSEHSGARSHTGEAQQQGGGQTPPNDKLTRCGEETE